MTLREILDLRYSGGLSYQNLIKDEDIMAHLPIGYLPKFEVTGTPPNQDVFLKPLEYVTTPADGAQKVYYFYMNMHGQLKNDPEASMVQVNRRYKGFLARVHYPMSAQTPNNLVLDYIIDLDHITLSVASNIGALNAEIAEETMIYFESIDRDSYPPSDMNWFEALFEFELNRNTIFHLINN